VNQVAISNLIMQKLMDSHLSDIQEVCKRRHVRNLYVFGSALTNRFTDKSDIDFLVDFGAIPLEDYADNYFDLCADLEAVLGRRVDVVTMRSIKNPYFESEVLKTRQLVFEG
jgi:predicted nucleotidyltransferase